MLHANETMIIWMGSGWKRKRRECHISREIHSFIRERTNRIPDGQDGMPRIVAWVIKI